MAHDEFLGDRIRNILKDKRVQFSEKKMFGGLCFMVDDKMCIGIIKEDLMARVGQEVYEESLLQPGVEEMNITGRPLNGYLSVKPQSIDSEEDLSYWIQKCLDFNPHAKSSKKKK